MIHYSPNYTNLNHNITTQVAQTLTLGINVFGALKRGECVLPTVEDL